MRLAFISWLAVIGISFAQTSGGFTGGGGGGNGSGGFGGSGGGSSRGFSGGSGSGSNSMQAGVSAPSLLGSFSSRSSGRNTNSAVSSSNLLSSYYYNPYAQGLISGSGQASTATGFGQAVYSANGAM